MEFVSGSDPYEIPRDEWEDDVDLWPEVTHIHIGMYLLFMPSPYTKEDHKSLDFYINFASGWVREVLLKCFDDKRLRYGSVSNNMQ